MDMAMLLKNMDLELAVVVIIVQDVGEGRQLPVPLLMAMGLEQWAPLPTRKLYQAHWMPKLQLFVAKFKAKFMR